MSFIPDEKLFSYSDRVDGKVVIITGAANGIGKEAALRFAQYGAKVVIGDLDVGNAEAVVKEINSKKGTATCIRCDVTNWDDQVAMFELAMKEYGSVDIVVPNAGIKEMGGRLKIGKDGKPLKPSFKTLDVNLNGALYTIHLALHYLFLNPGSSDSLKALILIGSMASWQAIRGAPLYSGSKHAILGIMRSLSVNGALLPRPIRLGCIHPFFVDTDIVPTYVKLVLAGIPFTTVERVAGAIFYAATDPDENTNACSWMLADDTEVFMIPKEKFKSGIYEMIDRRVNRIQASVVGIRGWYAIVRDVCRVVGKPVLLTGLVVAAAKVAWNYQHAMQYS